MLIRPLRRRLLRGVALALPLLLAACGGNPTAPSPGPSTTRVMVLTGDLAFNQVDIGQTATATFTIGNTGTAPLTVTSITGTGPLTSQAAVDWTAGVIAPGASQEVRVAFYPLSLGTYSGVLMVSGDQTSGTNTIPYSAEVVAGTPFAGSWSGSYRIDSCQGVGSAQDLLCSAPSGGRAVGLYPPGTVLPMTLSLAQSGESVSGTLTLGELTGPVTGAVANGLLTLRGSFGSGAVRVTTVHWSSRVIGRTMDGVAAYTVALPGFPGTGVLQTTLVVNK